MPSSSAISVKQRSVSISFPGGYPCSQGTDVDAGFGRPSGARSAGASPSKCAERTALGPFSTKSFQMLRLGQLVVAEGEDVGPIEGAHNLDQGVP